MAWQDRISDEAAYTPPGGQRLTFLFEDLRRNRDLRGTRYQFVDTDGTFAQRTGASGQEFPIRMFFSGDDHDLQADAMYAALSAGVGLLEHPRHGAVTVAPMGRLVQRDDLKTAANQTIMEVTFWETLEALFPTGQQDPASQVQQAVEEFNAAAAAEFDQGTTLAAEIESIDLASRITAITGQVDTALAPIADTVQAVEDQFTDIKDSIDDGIDTLVGQPLTLAFQISQLIQAPARALSSWGDKLDAYNNLASSLISGSGASQANDNRPKNEFRANDLSASSAITGTVLSAVNTEFTTQPDAIQAAQEVLALSETVNTWREAEFTRLELVDTGAAYQQWQEAVAICAGFLVEISFTLAQERVLVLDRPRNIVELCAELYGEVDAQLDFLINSNDLTGDEIKELPVGKAVRYYV